MTSFQNNISVLPSSPKLPAINSDEISESSSLLSFRHSLPWIGPLRKRLNHSLGQHGQPEEEDLAELVKEMTKVMISALQPTVSKQAWLNLNYILTSVQPYKDFLDSPAVQHYVERLCHYYFSNMEKLFDVPIIDSLKNVFPKALDYAQTRHGNDTTGCGGKVKSQMVSQSLDFSLSLPPADSEKTPPHQSLPDGQNPYSLLRKGGEPERHFRRKHLKLRNLNEHLPAVAMETAAIEAVWKEGKSATVTAIGVDLPGAEAVSDRASSIDSFESTQHAIASDFATKKTTEFVAITGRQAVELFLKHKHLHKIRFIYLNRAKTKDYRPYELVSVPREKLEKEHYIFSTFGVLHVYPDGNHSETFTLADWNRNAVLWGILRRIPFFKNYLIRKTFSRWWRNTKRIRFERTRAMLAPVLLHAVPDFGCALLHVFRLMYELSEVRFLPGPPVVALQYTIKEFESDSYKIKLEVNRVLEMFFRYCKKIVETTRESCFEQLKFYEYQARQTKPLFVKESLYLQRRKRQLRAKKLRMARVISRRVPAFVTLIDQAIAVQLVAIVRAAVTHFVDDVLTMQEDDDEVTVETLSTATESMRTKASDSNKEQVEIFKSVFAAKFVFNKETHQLEMHPSLNEFRAVMKESIDGILRLLCDRSCTMHSMSKSSDPQRPGSAPAKFDSAQSDPDASSRSSVSTFASDFRSSQADEEEEAEDERKELITVTPQVEQQLQLEDIDTAPPLNVLTEPKVSVQELPTKDDENDLVATPDMVVRPSRSGMLGLVVGGRAMLGFHSPLDQSTLMEKILEDPEIYGALKKQAELVQSAVKEVAAFCSEQNEWIVDIRRFTSSWSDAEADKWKGQPATAIEELLNLLKAWSEKVKNMDRAIVTTNRLLYVDCRMPAYTLVPQLSSIFRRIIALVVSEAKFYAEQVMDESKEALKVLKNKNTDVKSFAEYASLVATSQTRKQDLTEKVTYIRSLFEVVRMTYRQLTQDEEKLEEKVKSMWEAFLFQLKDATNFVANQRPIIVKHLDEAFSAQYDQAVNLARKASTGKMIDPNADANEVINELESSISTFQEHKSRLKELSRYKESACGQTYDLQLLDKLGTELLNRLELWKYVGTASNAIAEWKATPFRKFNAQGALDKVVEWQQTSQMLRQRLPDDDPVLTTWSETLDKMSEDLPLLQKLSNEAMKPRHWREVFTGMGESYEAGWTFTVEEILAYRPSLYADIIAKVHSGAEAEFRLEQLMRKIKRQWETRQFQLAKHIHVVQKPVAMDVDSSGSLKNLPANHEKRLFKQPQKMFYTQEIDSDTFILVRVNDLLHDLLESHVTLQGMLQSRHLLEVRSDAEIWSDTLQQIGEIVNLWVSCQDKWMFLSKVFSGEPTFTSSFEHLLPKFKEVDKQYRVFIHTMVQDPKVLSVLSRLPGQKGWRELQGDVLRRHLLSCIQQEDEILRGIDVLLEDFRFRFPRLYFLSDDDCVRLLGITRQPKALAPFVRKCFPGIRSLCFDLPHPLSTKQMKNAITLLDMELYSHRLEVTRIFGTFKDALRISPLPAHNSPTVWLGALEQKMKKALSTQLKSLIETRLREGTPNVTDAFTELHEVEALISGADLEVHVFNHWMLKYPSQIVLLSNAILWYRYLAKFFQQGAKKARHEDIKKDTVYKLKQLSQAMQDHASSANKSSAHRRLHALFSALTMQTVYHRDVLRSIEQNYVTCTTAYEWQSILKHRADITMYSELLTTKSRGKRTDEPSSIGKIALVGDCYIEHLDSRDDYGYEFMSMKKSGGKGSGGVGMGTVITPLTERCLVSLSLTRRMHQCGGLFGPNSAGKSLAIDAFSQAYGRMLVNLTCSEDLNANVLKRCLCGVVQSGAWICFDHADRLQQTTLSLLSHYIKQIHTGYTILEESVKAEYPVRGDDGMGKLKRSNSLTTLHRTSDFAASRSWRPEVFVDFLPTNDITAADDNDWRDAYASQARPAGKQVGSLVLEDKLLSVNDGFAMFMTFSTGPGKYPEIPDSLKEFFRPVCMIKPDVPKLIEVWLQACGFVDSVNLAKKLHLASQLLQASADHISGENDVSREAAHIAGLNLDSLRSIITLAGRLASQAKTQQRSRTASLSENVTPGDHPVSSSSSTTSISRSSRRSELILASHNEEQAMIEAFSMTYVPKLGSPSSVAKFKESLRNIFPTCTRLAPAKQESVLAESIRTQMYIAGLQPAEAWVEKACQLALLLQLNPSVIVAGAAGSGKSSMCRILVQALNSLSTAVYMAGLRDSNTPLPPSVQKSKIQSNARSPAALGVNPNAPEAAAAQGTDGFHGLLPKEFNTRIDFTPIFPNVHSVSDLFGCFNETTGAWKPGLIAKLMKECYVMHKKRWKTVDKKDTFPDSTDPPLRRTTEVDYAFASTNLRKWIVLDGDMLPTWVDNISCLLDDHAKTYLRSMADLTMPTTTNFIFEVANFASASPAIATRCAILHCNVPENWRHVARSWFDDAYGQYALTRDTMRTLRDLVEDVVPPILSFLRGSHGSVSQTGLAHCEKEANSSGLGMRQMKSFFDIFSSCLAAHNLTREARDVSGEKDSGSSVEKRSPGTSGGTTDDSRSTRASSVRSRLDDGVPEMHHDVALRLFAFAFVWAFGGDLQENDMARFDMRMKEAFRKSRHNIYIPPYETVYDYFVDEETGNFSLWEDRIDLRPRADVPSDSSYVALHQLERYAHLASILLTCQHSVLLVGEPGVGKSSLVKNVLQVDHEIHKIPISPGLTSLHFQRLIESKASPLSKQHNIGLMAHPNAVIASRSAGHQSVLFFLDDLSYAASTKATKECSVANQPCLELLRQVFTLRGVYELEHLLFKSLETDLAFVATTTTPGIPGAGLGYACHTLSPRLTRNFTVLHFLKPNRDTILSMHHTGVQSWLEEFPAYSLVRHYDLSQAIIAGAYDLYCTVCAHLKPSPQQPHYIFSLHDINRIMQGLFLMSPRNRGRPKPVRRKGPGMELRRRPGAGKQANRFRGNRALGDPSAGVGPMMKVVVRLWLHECTRVFHDRLINQSDKQWFSRVLLNVLKEQFCMSKDQRSLSPAIEKVRIIKTPVPSSGPQPTGESPEPSPRSIDFAVSSTGGEETDTFIQSSPNNSALQAGYDADESIASEGSVVSETQQEVYLAEAQEASAAPSPFDTSTSASVAKTSEYYDTDGDATQSSSTKPQSTTSSSSVKKLHVPSTSSQLDTSVDDGMSETTTANQEPTTTSGDYESRATTAVTGEDDGVSTTTGFTAGAESECETESILADTNGTESATTGGASEAKDLGADSPVKAQDSTLYPSSGSSEDEYVKLKQPAAAGPKQSKPSRPGGARLGVTFVPGLIDDVDDAADLSEPLLSLQEVLQESEVCTSMIFSQGILHAAFGENYPIDSYFQSTEAQLGRALTICLNSYNGQMESDEDCMELVFFGQATRHAARLSRVMHMKGGHALLLSSSRFTGRRSLTKFVAHLSQAKMFLLNCKSRKADKSNRNQLRSLIKQASFEAGVQNTRAVLMVDGGAAADRECLDDVCALVKEGQCPALYTHRELAKIASEIAPGKPGVAANPSDPTIAPGRLTTMEKIDQYLETYFARVVSNLHVIILVDCPDFESTRVLPSERTSVDSYFHSSGLRRFHQMLKSCPDLLTRFSCIDLYRSWDHSSLQKVAYHFLQSYTGLQDGEFLPSAEGIKLPWSFQIPPREQEIHVSHVMAYMHKDALARAKVSLTTGAEELVNPGLIEQMVQLFIGIAKCIRKKEEQLIRQLDKALRKVHDAEGSMQERRQQRDLLLPLLEDARECERSWQRHVDEERQEYAEAQERCAAEEENIEKLENELVVLQKAEKHVTRKLKPLFESAQAASDALSQNGLWELKRYAKPPESAVLVVNCLCHMFNVSPANWENGRSLIGREKFFQDLQFYDKDNIPTPVFHTIQRYVHTPEFVPEHVAKGSKAAAELCAWVHAIYQYAKTLRTLQPILDAEKSLLLKLDAAKATLGSKRVRSYQIKNELDSKIQKHKDAAAEVWKYTKGLDDLDALIAEGDVLMNSMLKQIQIWRLHKEKAQSRLESAVGDSALMSAAVTYFGSLPSQQRKLAIKKWLNVCMNASLDAESNTLKLPDNEKHGTSKDIQSESEKSTDALSDDLTSGTGDSKNSIPTKSVTGYRGFLQVRGKVNPIDILSSPSQQRAWHKAGLSRDVEARFDALRLRSLCLHQDLRWCLLYDPDDQAVTWLHVIFEQLRKDVESGSFETPTPTLSRQSRLSVTSATSLTESIGPVEQRIFSASISPGPSEDTESPTDVTISVTTSGAVRTESAKRSTSAGSKGVRFADAESKASVNKRDSPNLTDGKSPRATDTKEPRKHKVPLLHPLNRLWVCKASDPGLERLLASATSHGAFVYVTNIEETSLEHFDFVVKRSSDAEIHQNFRLFLGTSTPIELTSQTVTDMYALPVQRYAVTDLALRDEGLFEQLDKAVLNQEGTEFEAQRRLMEADNFHLEEHLEQMDDKLLSRVTGGQDAVLLDQELLGVFQMFDRENFTAWSSLKETKRMEHNLMQKKSDLSEVAVHGQQLFNAFKAASHLRPHVYNLTASQFIDLYKRCLHAHVRGRNNAGNSLSVGASGALIKSRTVELKQALTETMIDLAERRMVETHALVFASLVTFDSLINHEKMTDQELNELVHIGKKPTRHPLDDDVVSLDKPSWMSEARWRDLLHLISRYPVVYKGLARSISSRPKLWQEYFDYSPVLLAKVPSTQLHHLTLGQKALLWKAVCPDVFSKIVSDLNTSVLGGVAARRNVLDVDSILKDLSAFKPCCFILPEKPEETCYVPALHVQQKAKMIGRQYVERSAEFNDDLGDVMEMCMINGGWLMLHNCHLATRWPEKFLKLLAYLFVAEHEDERQRADMRDAQVTFVRTVSTTTDAEGEAFVTESIKRFVAEHRTPCNPNFQLWLVTRGHDSLIWSMPMRILHHAELVTVGTPTSHKDLVVVTHRLLSRFSAGMRLMEPAAAPLTAFGKRDAVPLNIRVAVAARSEMTHHLRLALKLSLLHGVLLDRAHWGRSAFASPCTWSDGEMTGVLGSVAATRRFAVATRLCSAFMTGHIAEARDLEVSQLLTDVILKLHPVPKNSILTKDLETILKMWKNPRSGFETLLQKPDLLKLGLNPSADKSKIKQASAEISALLESICGLQADRRGLIGLSDVDVDLARTAREHHMKRTLDNLVMQVREAFVPEVHKHILSPVMAEFYSAEVKRLKLLISLACTDLSMCLALLKGDIEASEELQGLMRSVTNDEIPAAWLRNHYDLLRFHRSSKLSRLINNIALRCSLLERYMNAATEPMPTCSAESPGASEVEVGSSCNRRSSSTQTMFAYNLSVFTRPDYFLTSILLTVARTKHHDAHKYKLVMQFASTDDVKHNAAESQQQPGVPFERIFIDGLYLHNAMFDRKSRTMHQTKSSTARKMPLLEVRSEKTRFLPRYTRVQLEDIQATSMFNCPLWLNENELPEMCSSSDIVTYVPIASEDDHEQWITQGTALLSRLEDH